MRVLRDRSIRWQVTAIASMVVALVLLAGSIALVLIQRSSLTAGLDESLAQRAEIVADMIQRGEVELDGLGPERFTQVVDSDGRVVVASPNLEGIGPLALDGRGFRTVGGVPIDDDSYRVLTIDAGDVSIHVGASYDSVEESIAILVGSLAFTVPALTLILGAIIWWLVGRTLRPVESIREEVEAIGAHELHRRVPEPHSGDEIARLAETMNRMLDRLESSVRREQQFVADASHELRIPLTRLRTQLELAEREAIVGQDVAPVLEEVDVMQRMVDHLLFLARSDEGRLQVDKRPVDLDDVVFSEADRVSVRGRAAIDISEVSGAHVLGDKSQLSRAVRNLLDNAERYAASAVTLSLREVGAEALLVVSDDGPGVPIEAADRIFDRFGRADDARSTETGGVGLGLAIAREVVERHGGSLRLANPGEKGARFEMRIPIAQ